jgi:hypothetical protein
MEVGWCDIAIIAAQGNQEGDQEHWQNPTGQVGQPQLSTQQGTVEAPEGGNCPIAYMLLSKLIML